MKKFLLSIFCFLTIASVAKADEMVVTFGPGNKYDGNIANKVEFAEENDNVDDKTFELPGLGSFTLPLITEKKTDKNCNLSKGGSAGNPHLAIFKNYKIAFKFDEGITVTDMEFNCPTAKYTLKLDPSDGSTCAVDTKAKTITWKGSATSSLDFTDNAGAIRITWIIIKYTKGGSTGIEEVAADSNAAPEEYYNLQGVRVNNPENGVYVMRQGANVKKVYVK